MNLLIKNFILLFKLGCLGGVLFASGNHLYKVLNQHKWHTFSLNAKLLFKVPQKVTEIDVEKLAFFVNHDVVRVTIANA
jgi:hypothetical protein